MSSRAVSRTMSFPSTSGAQNTARSTTIAPQTSEDHSIDNPGIMSIRRRFPFVEREVGVEKLVGEVYKEHAIRHVISRSHPLGRPRQREIRFGHMRISLRHTSTDESDIYQSFAPFQHQDVVA